MGGWVPYAFFTREKTIIIGLYNIAKRRKAVYGICWNIKKKKLCVNNRLRTFKPSFNLNT